LADNIKSDLGETVLAHGSDWVRNFQPSTQRRREESPWLCYHSARHPAHTKGIDPDNPDITGRGQWSSVDERSRIVTLWWRVFNAINYLLSNHQKANTTAFKLNRALWFNSACYNRVLSKQRNVKHLRKISWRCTNSDFKFLGTSLGSPTSGDIVQRQAVFFFRVSRSILCYYTIYCTSFPKAWT
jgi:hypothetical protein